MIATCLRCHENEREIFNTMCKECKRKQKRKDQFVMFSLCVVALLVLLGIRALWAKVFYKDWHCAFAECRIKK